VGTLALNAATYADIAVRGRPLSDVPADTVGKMADRIGLDLGHNQAAAHRRTGIGALLGYATGLTLGAGYGALRVAVPRVPLPVAGVALAVTAMIGANAGAVEAGATDPRRWGVEGWLADIVPHLCFGFATAAAFDLLDRR
jgi:hypothetical protein